MTQLFERIPFYIGNKIIQQTLHKSTINSVTQSSFKNSVERFLIEHSLCDVDEIFTLTAYNI